MKCPSGWSGGKAEKKMLDLERIRENPQWLDDGLKKRGLEPLSGRILSLDKERRALQTRIQSAQAQRNDVSKRVGEVKKAGGNADELMAEVAKLKEQMANDELAEIKIAADLQLILDTHPNIPMEDVPVGKDEKDNFEAFKFKGRHTFNFKPKDHVELGESLGLIDFAAAAKLSGARFVVTKGLLSRLERAIGLFGIDLLTQEFGYTEVTAPLLVNDVALYGTSNLPKFEEDLFKTNTGHYLIPTSEVSVTNLVNDAILNESDFPLRYTAYTPCFRSEAGSAGKDTRGMIRQHQFYKVEQVVICKPEDSAAEHERMVKISETALQRLDLPYRKVLLCTGDMGFASQKTYDIETWIPSQDTYRETMSCSNCGDFQARRMKARFRRGDGKKTEFVHTLNATLFATGRMLVAIMENYQNEDGSIRIPDVLQPYMNCVKEIRA
jgi:seryl-tRNA synthetase